MSKLTALMFDCDGVLAETERDGHRVSFNKVFEQQGIDAYWDEAEYGDLVKVSGGKERMAAYFSQYPEKYSPERFTPEYIAQLHKLKTAAFLELCGDLPIRPGVRRLMLEAHRNGLHIFICSTSNESSVSAIARSVLGEAKDKVLTKIYAGDVVKSKKPAPDIYLLPLEQYGLDADRCIVFEDTQNGLRAAISAGIKCIVTTSIYSGEEDFSGALAVVECLGDEGTPCRPLAGQLPPDTGRLTLADIEKLL